MSAEPPRLLPDRPLPPYAFFGGGPHPHPRRDPHGHSHGEPEPEPPPLDADRWQESPAYLYGIDLYNHGFHWEAHEQWEALWIAAGRRGPVAEFLKGLIKLAACGIKARQGRARGIRRHARRAAGHFRQAAGKTGEEVFAGLHLEELNRIADRMVAGADDLAAQREIDSAEFSLVQRG